MLEDIVWRILSLKQRSPAEIAAMEEVFLAAAQQGRNTLAFHEWEPGFSLANGQRADDLHIERLKQDGISVVRTRVGGRAVYHDAKHSISYCLGVHASHFPHADKKNPRKAYEHFLTGVVSALNELGVPAEVHDKNYVRVHGKKVSGNALVLSGDGVVLHGSLLVDIPDEEAYINKILRYVNLRDDPADVWREDMRGMLTSVRQYSSASRQEIVDVLKKHLAPLSTTSELLPQEYADVKKLAETKYATAHWKKGPLMVGLCWRKYGTPPSQTRGINPEDL